MAKKKGKTQDDEKKGITVKKDEDIAEWYSQICIKGELADYAPVKGCMIIRPNGYALWQKIQDYFNNRLKELHVKNAYFPLFIPEGFFKKEAEHAKGFKAEVAWLDKKVTGEGERLAVRPTSETIMYDSYSKWVRSWRDLPLRINQWCNIVRWETEATKLFLRSREFLWQEGHCVYETEKDCDKDTLIMINEYKDMVEKLLAMPVLVGRKTDKEKFAGAKYTNTIEAFMPDGKALQCGTSHNLGQGFSKSFGIKFIDRHEIKKVPWQNSWGFSTRLIGGMVMLHSDDKGLVIPPHIAPIEAVIVPIVFEKGKSDIMDKCTEIKDILSEEFDVILDDRDEYSAGWKFNEWEMKGVPIRIELGPKDLKEKQVVLVSRDDGSKENVKIKDLVAGLRKSMLVMQERMLKKAKKALKKNTVEVGNWDDFVEAAENRKMIKARFCGKTDCEDLIKDKTEGITTRCIPFDEKLKTGKCIHCGKEAVHTVYFSKSY